MDWQLGNWIRSSQQSCPAEGHCDTRAPQTPRPPPPSQSLTVEPGWEAKAQQESTQKAGKPLASGERHQQSSKPPGSPTPPSPTPGLTGCSHEHSCTSNSSSSVKAGNVETPPNVGCEKVDRDPRFTVRPKVKTKMAPSRKKERKEKKRTCKHQSQDERKAGSESEVALVLYAHCPSCGGQSPNSCSCPPHSPAQPDQPSPVPPGKVSCTSSKSHAVCQKGTKVPPKTVHKHLDKTPRSSRDPHRYPRSLLVKIDLGLLSKVPPVSRNHQESLCREKKDASAAKAREGRSGGAAAAQKVGKSGKKSHNVRDENQPIQSGLSLTGLVSA